MWREECGKDKFKWNHDHPQDFAICFWQKSPKVLRPWIAYRIFIVLYFSLSIFVVNILRAGEDVPWYKIPITYYNWVDFTEMLAFALGLAICVQRYRQEKKDPELPPLEKMPLHYQLMWCTYITAAPCAAVVTISFCLFVHDKDEYPYLKYSIITHVCNTVVFVIDFSVCAVPFRILHFYLPVAFTLTYDLFTIIYEFSGGTGFHGEIAVYETMDWRIPSLAFGSLGRQILCLASAFTAFWVMKELKMWAKRREEKAEAEADAEP